MLACDAPYVVFRPFHHTMPDLRTYLCLPILISTLELAAQPVVHAVNHLPVPGTMREVYFADSVPEPLPGGSNVTWDFSWLDMTPDDTVWYVGPTGMPEAELEPDAAVAVVDTLPWNLISPKYYGLDSEGLWRSAIRIILSHCSFGMPYHALPAEITYGESFGEGYANSCTDNVGQWTDSSSFAAAADGWGTLLMPWGEVPHVLRVAGTDSSRRYSPPPDEVIPSYSTFEQYYFDGVIEPVVSISRHYYWNIIGQEWLNDERTLTFIVDPSLGLQTERDATGTLWPNPAHDWVRLALPFNVRPLRAELFDAIGRYQRMWPLSGSAHYILDLMDVAEGAYVLVVTDGSGKRTTLKLVKG